MTTEAVIRTLLKKYNIIDHPSKFALYERRPASMSSANTTADTAINDLSADSNATGKVDRGSAVPADNLARIESVDQDNADPVVDGGNLTPELVSRRLGPEDCPLEVCLRWSALGDPRLFNMCRLSLQDSLKGHIMVCACICFLF